MFHSKHLKEVFIELNSSEKGLSQEEVKARLEKFGPNEVKAKRGISPLQIFISQFKSIIVWILVAAVIISLFLKEYIDASVIGAILILNAIIGFFQEFKAEKSIEALKKMISQKAKVIRDDKEQIINAIDLVPGDILLLESGDKVPSDARLFEIINLHLQEAALTGESIPVAKDLKELPEKTALADKHNMVFSGTIVTTGKAKAIVTDTGMSTQIGKIAKLISETKADMTPLQQKTQETWKISWNCNCRNSFNYFYYGGIYRHSPSRDVVDSY